MVYLFVGEGLPGQWLPIGVSPLTRGGSHSMGTHGSMFTLVNKNLCPSTGLTLAQDGGSFPCVTQ